MAITIFKSAISVLCALLLLSPALGISDVPFIVAHKKASLNRLKSGVERVSVSIDIYNQGSATAYDVTVSDDSWSHDAFDIVSGNLSHSWERLDAGGLLSHSSELEAKEKGMFFGAPAVITFRIPTKAASQVAYSTPILPLDVLADRPPEKKFEWKLLAKYGSLISVISIIVLFVYLITTPSKSGAAKGSKKKR
ncbi:hypothetical protein CDL15_Pgr005585 [Punica granatum]|uniref:Translocon-associated protein subunit beta n=1 Tax=Punica granatum TaxID=22663 RepID=A0A218WFZ7_PUNGR|nr:hypothetical protein CDL15_Pgr005585 [Punica granatum]